MNNMNCNSPIRFGLNNINPFEFNQSGQTFPNLRIPVKVNPNGNNRSDSNLIRPIPKKLDLSHMIYQQIVDPYPKQTQSNLFDVNEIVSQNLFSQIYSNPISNSISRNFNNNTATSIRKPDISYSIPNSNSPFNSHRLIFNQYYSTNLSPIDNRMYSSATGVPGQRVPISTTGVDSYMFNRDHCQLPMRNNCINDVTYKPINNSKEVPLTTALYEEVKSITTTQFYPKMSFSDDLIESHFSMSLNSHRKFNFKNQESLSAATKQERTTKKSSKQQIKYVEKSTKLLKRVKKTKSILNYLDPMQQDIVKETSETLCATPNDSSISPSSMVSCRSTITPQAVNHNINNLALISQSPHSNNLSSISRTEQLESSLNVQNISDMHQTFIPKSQNDVKSTSDFLVQGLPIKKRIKWQNEEQEKERKSEIFKNVTRTVTNSKLERSQNKFAIGESINENTETANNGLYATISEDPLRTVPKTFLPMEKSIDLTDSESEDEAGNIDYNNSFSLKNHNEILFVDNNI